MFGLAPETPDLLCPHCHRPMADMAFYQRSIGVDGGIGSDSPLLIFRHRGAAINPFAVGELISTLIDSILNAGRDRKGARLCREILPQFPKSLICSQCLFVYRRK